MDEEMRALVGASGRPGEGGETQTDLNLRRVEQELERRQSALERSNRDLEQFAYIASHELQEPLRMVSEYVGLIQRRYAGRLDEEARAFLDFAADGASRMRELISDLLAYSRVDAAADEPAGADAEQALAQALQNLRSAIEESGAVVEAESLPSVRVGATQLMQVFQNLLANAIKFHSEDAPRIRVSAESVGGEEW
ncbi:MAG: histidine kinase dimerization/phospho-acceptor domain-containing protein, partial [Solirubrobacterales bacterium]